MLLAFDDDGPGPVVVLLHGFPLDRRMWDLQRAEVGSVYRVITPDLRGHGETAVPDGVYAIDTMADDVIDTLDALNLTDPVVLGGHSMGGYVALSIALRHPDRLRGLVLINTRAGADGESTARGREDLARAVERDGTAGPVVEAMLPKLFSPVGYARNPQAVETIRAQMARTDPRAVANTLRGMATRPDRTGDLGRIGVPTLVLAGADDQMIPIDESRSIAEGIPGARLIVIPDSGHMAPIENKAATDRALLDFLGSIS